jgi:hypothetical protein
MKPGETAPSSLASKLGEGGDSLKLLPLYPRGKSLGINWAEGWVGTNIGLDAVEMKKKSFTTGNRTPTVKSVACLYTYPDSKTLLHGIRH